MASFKSGLLPLSVKKAAESSSRRRHRRSGVGLVSLPPPASRKAPALVSGYSLGLFFHFPHYCNMDQTSDLCSAD